MNDKRSQRKAAVRARLIRRSIRKDNQSRSFESYLNAANTLGDPCLVTPRHPIPVRGWVITIVIASVLTAAVMAVTK